MVKFVWKKEVVGGYTLYRVTVFDSYGECIYQTVVYKNYSSLYRKVMYSFNSSYRSTLKEIKKVTEDDILRSL